MTTLDALVCYAGSSTGYIGTPFPRLRPLQKTTLQVLRWIIYRLSALNRRQWKMSVFEIGARLDLRRL